MNPRQYRPFTYLITDIPLIVYPVKDENPLTEVFDQKDHMSLQKHLDNLYQQYSKQLKKGSYHIIFVWNLEKNRMVDVWIHDMKNWSDSGPLLECVTFKNLEVCHDAGIASGDSIIVLGREEELRRKIANLKEYLDREKYLPEFPVGMKPTESFYK